MSVRAVFCWVLCVFSVDSFAEQPEVGPVIEGYGPSFIVPEKDIPLVEDFQYQVVFELAKYSPDTTSMNAQLVRVARFVNMHARQGVSMEQMDLAVVAHADALKSMLNHASYRERFGSDNPNLDLLEKLADAGVKMYVCGQSMGFRQWELDELAKPVKVGLSAMTLIANHQATGFTFQP